MRSPEIDLAAWIEGGTLLGHVFGTENLETVPVVAPSSGYLFAYGFVHEDRKSVENEMKCYHPYVRQGEAVAVLYGPGAG